MKRFMFASKVIIFTQDKLKLLRYILLALLSCITITAIAGNTKYISSEEAQQTSKIASILQNHYTISPQQEHRSCDVFPSFADIVEPLIPAVVNIYTVQYSKKSQYRQKTPFSEGFPFDQFNDFFEQFNIPFNFEEMYSNPKAVSLGSGFIVDQAGFIVTNHHVISNADEIHVKLIDNTELPAKLIGTDQRTDLALLKVETKHPLPHVKFGDSAKSRVGDWIIAIGNPFGLGGTVTTGIISSKGRDIDANTGGIVDDFIQTDAAINSGNSGGPMFNLVGEVIGVNTAIFSPSGTNIGIGFSIPSNTAQAIIEQLKKNGKISRGRLDVTIQEVTADIAEALGLKEVAGALVAEVMMGGAADKAGIKAGDIITEFAGQPVKNSRKLQILVAETQVDKEIQITVIRGGKTHILNTKITDTDTSGKLVVSPDNKNFKLPQSTIDTIEKNHITFSNLTDEIRKKFNIKDAIDGVVITNLDKDQRNYGLKIGDVVIAINQQYINNVAQLQKYYESAKSYKKQNVILLIKRRAVDLFVAIPVI